MALTILPTIAGAQPVGSEFQVNTYTTSVQSTYSHGGHLVAADASGNFVVVSYGQGPGDTVGVFARRYDSSGVPIGSEFRVNSFTTNRQDVPSVASDASGNFVVVWQGFGQGDFDGIFGQRFDSGGMPLGEEFRVNTSTLDFQNHPSVGSDAGGNFVVVWWGLGPDGYEGKDDILGQRYDNAGNALGGEFRVNSYTRTDQYEPSVASDPSGNFVVVWSSIDQDGCCFGAGVFGQRYDNEGNPLGGEFQVNSYTTGDQRRPSVASDADGNFVVVWQSRTYLTDNEVFGQRYDSAGVPQGEEFHVNSYTTREQASPSIAVDAGGNFVVAWQSGRFLGNYEVFAKRYDSEGVAQGGEFQLNAFTIAPQQQPFAKAIGPNRYVVVWESVGQDGSGHGVFGKRFGREPRER